MSKSILVVEDDADLRDSLREILSGEGYRVLLAADGHQALRILGEEGPRPEAILLDLRMNGMGGDEFLHILRTRHSDDFGKIPVLLISASPGAADDARYAAIEKLKKPFELEELLAKVALLVG